MTDQPITPNTALHNSDEDGWCQNPGCDWNSWNAKSEPPCPVDFGGKKAGTVGEQEDWLVETTIKQVNGVQHAGHKESTTPNTELREKMRVLIACEYSGRVREAFRKLGHDAWSCDLLPAEDGSPYHYQGDVLEHLDEGWDLMIAHPPCTYLSNAGLHYIISDSSRGMKVAEALHFFLQLYNAKIPMVAVENPIGYMNTHFRKPDQIIQPFWFGEAERKATCLWLRGLPKLEPTDMVEVKPRGTIIRKTGPKAGKKYNYYYHNGRNAHERSRTFQSIANAMAQQWGAQLNPQKPGEEEV